MEKQLKEAPKYQISDKGIVTNIEKGNAIAVDEKGFVRVPSEFEGKPIRIRLNVKELVFKYFKSSDAPKVEKPAVNDIDVVAEEVSQTSKSKTGADLIRDAYYKDPENFSCKDFAKESGISYARVWGCIKKEQSKKSTGKDA